MEETLCDNLSTVLMCCPEGQGRSLNFKSRNLQPEVSLCPESQPYGTPQRGNEPANRKAEQGKYTSARKKLRD